MNAEMRGTSEDFEDLFRAEYPRMLRTASMIVGDVHGGREVVQEAFARAFARWSRISRYDRPGAWVRRVTIRLALRARGAPQARHLSAAVDLAGPTSDIATHLAVRQALARLSGTQRAAVVLYYLDDLPTSDVALALGCREATVRVHLHRARRALADLLEEEMVP